MKRGRFQPGYTLIELLVVMAVLALLGALSVPSAFGANDRYLLDNSASQVKQMIIEAKTKSLTAASNNQIAGQAQFYQLTLGNFAGFGKSYQSGSDNTAYGDDQTKVINLETASLDCNLSLLNSSDVGGRTTVNSYKLPRDIFIGSFFPYPGGTQPPYQGFLRFPIGRLGFQCGTLGQVVVDSAVSAAQQGWVINPWFGFDSQLQSPSQATKLFIEIKSKRIAESRYVSVDRLTSEVTISKSRPDEFFSPVDDTYPPQWLATDQEISLVCGAQSTNVIVKFSRAKDFYGSGASDFDDNRAVFYDLDWSLDGTVYQPLVSQYLWSYSSPSGTDYVSYSFSTHLIKTTSQPEGLWFKVKAYDQNTNVADPIRSLAFVRSTDWTCNPGNGAGYGVSPGPAQNLANNNKSSSDAGPSPGQGQP